MLMDLFLVLIFILISLKDYYNGFEEADWDPDSSAILFGDFKEISEYPGSSCVLFTFWQKGEIAENLW